MKKQYYGNSKLGGVYKITNTKNGKFYIGSAKCFQVRAHQHQTSLKNNRHSNSHLQASWNKWGEDVFLFEVIEVVDGDKGERYKVEQNYIDNLIKEEKWKKTFNFKKKAVQKERSCFSKSPEITRKRKSEAMKRRMSTPEGRKQIQKILAVGQKTGYRKGMTHTEETKKKMSLSHKGKKLSDETKKKLSIINKGNTFWKGKKHSAETKEKMSKIAKKRYSGLSSKEKERRKQITLKNLEKAHKKIREKTQKPINAISVKTKQEYHFKSIYMAAKNLDVSVAGIYKILAGKTKNPQKWIFRYHKE